MDTTEAEQTLSYFRTKFLIYAFLYAGLFYYWMAFPVSNMSFENTGPQLPVDYRYGLTWFAVALTLINGAIPVACAWILVQPNSVFRADFHLLLVVLGMVCNFICFAGALLISLLFCSTVISNSAVGCNAAAYCCRYALSLPSECPSLVPCSPAVSSLLWWADEWSQHIWITFTFLILLILQWAENSDLRTTGIVKADKDRQESMVASLAILMLMTFVFYWFQAFVVSNLNFVHGYPAFDALSPGPFLSHLYGLQWIAVYLLNVNLIPLVLMAAVLFGQARHELVQKLHLRLTSHIVALLNIVILFYWLFVLVFNTNDWFGALLPSPGSISNGDDYCCDRFADHPDYCPNTLGCPSVKSLNPVFINVIVATLLFCITTVTHYIMNSRFVQYGLIKTSDV